MYGFVDTIPGSASSASYSLQTVFNGINLDQELTDENGSFITLTVSGRSNLSQKIQTIEVPGADGLIEQDDPTLESREITVKYKLTDTTNEGFRERYNRLNSLLSGSKKELKFTDEDALFYATLQNSEVPEEDSNSLIATIVFLCSDPYKYGAEKVAEFSTDAAIIHNEGTAPSYPVIEATAKQSVTSFMVAKGNEDYFMVGQPYDIDKEAIERYPDVAFYPMESLNGWSPMTEGFLFNDEVTGGIVTNGSVEVNGGTSFSPSTFGTQQSGWYGPAIRRSLPDPVGDFQITFGTSLYSNGNGIGKVMAILLDENDDIVASVGLINTRMGTRNARVLARMNDGKNITRTRVMDYPGDNGNESTVFSSTPLNIQLTREGNRFIAKTWQVSNGVAHARHSEEIISDVEGFQRPVHQVALFFAKYGANPSLDMQAIGMRVRENNTRLLDENLIPYIAHEGDKITVDSKNELVMINDEPVTELKDFGANYFALNPGENHLFTFPEGAFNTAIKYRPAYK